MFRFEHREILFLLIIIPVLLGIFIYFQNQRKRNLKRLGNSELIAQLMPNISFRRPMVKTVLLLVAVFFIIVALAQPQFGKHKTTGTRRGIEVMIALDVSNSMMAQDVAPNRLEKAKLIVSQLVDKMIDDKIGLIVFAGDAYVQLPITADYVSAKMFLQSISPEMVARQGTSIGTAIDLSIKSFGENKNKVGRAIVAITDGENHEDDAVAAAKLAQQNDIQVDMIGIGSPEGVPIPIPGTMSFRKDRQGNVVVSKLNEQMCQQIAAMGGGIYVRADNTNSAQRIISRQLDEIGKGTIETTTDTDFNEQFQSFALIALLLLIIDVAVFSRKNKTLSKIRIFDLKEKII
ncbi:MAG: VWA domain-containing protein [Prevotellaceae bacterium]|nr:VWA domain-containing protein [Prevotellaceae bacterium]